MDATTFWIYLAIMAGSTYLIRAVPLAAVRGRIENRFIKSFLYYIPYTVLTAMTLPAVFYATSHVLSAAAGLLVAVFLAIREKDLTTVAVAACAAVFAAELALV